MMPASIAAFLNDGQLVDLAVAGAGAVFLILLVSIVVLVRRLGGRDDEQKFRILAEQILAAMRGETEIVRALLANDERAVTGMLTQMQLSNESRMGAFSTDLAGRFGKLEVSVTEGLGQVRTGMETRLLDLSSVMLRGQGEARALLEVKLREMAEHTTLQLAAIQKTVNEQLHEAVEKQMQSSFQRVIDQFTAVQKAMVDVQAVTDQIGDLKRVFTNVKTRGGWGEAQLRAQLEDMLQPDSYVVNAKLREESAEVVEFAVRIPNKHGEALLLAVDAKFPVSDYERLLVASEAGDVEGERAARRGLETRLRQEGRKIAEKYIVANVTVDFAVMYLPTDGLYAEAARIPGLIDDLGRNFQVMVMGPSILPALLRTVRLGYMTLQLEEKAAQIGQLLGATKQEMQKVDEVLDRLAKNAGAMTNTIERARVRTRAVAKKLKNVQLLPSEAADAMLEIEGPDDEAAESEE